MTVIFNSILKNIPIVSRSFNIYSHLMYSKYSTKFGIVEKDWFYHLDKYIYLNSNTKKVTDENRICLEYPKSFFIKTTAVFDYKLKNKIKIYFTSLY